MKKRLDVTDNLNTFHSCYLLVGLSFGFHRATADFIAKESIKHMPDEVLLKYYYFFYQSVLIHAENALEDFKANGINLRGDSLT